jgi:hypothetical protein
MFPITVSSPRAFQHASATIGLSRIARKGAASNAVTIDTTTRFGERAARHLRDEKTSILTVRSSPPARQAATARGARDRDHGGELLAAFLRDGRADEGECMLALVGDVISLAD